MLADRPNLRRYLLFGLAMGVGALAKYNYLLFLSALLAAVLIDKTLRPVILDRRMLAGGAVSIAVTAPHFVWL